MRLLAAALVCSVFSSAAFAWDAHGHRLITRLALEGMNTGLGAESPSWLLEAGSREQIIDQAVTPDRWRSTQIGQLTHLNNPDHYLDAEELEPYGLTLETLPPLRYEYVKALALGRAKPGFNGKAVNPARDRDKTQEIPGFVPYSIVESYAKIQSAFRIVRILEKIDDPARVHQLEMARASARYNMGVMSHYVGDTAQPLHMTKHHHGWIGDNPKGYTTDRNIHSYIDGGVLRLHKIDSDMVRPRCRFQAKIEDTDPWPDVLTYLGRSFKEVEPLYELKRTGDLDKDPGREFICTRLTDASEMLAALYKGAWESSAPSQKDVEDFVRYDNFDGN